MHFDISDMEPQIACPNDVDNVKDISKVEGTHIDQCLVGSCTNGRLSDLKDAADILKDNKINDDVRLLILPASREIYRQAMHKGYIDTFIDAGAIICNPIADLALAGIWAYCQKGKFAYPPPTGTSREGWGSCFFSILIELKSSSCFSNYRSYYKSKRHIVI